MTEHENQQHQEQKGATQLTRWLADWPLVRNEIEAMIAHHAERDPSLHFALTLAEIELKDIDESVQRAAALARMLHNVNDLTSGELQATGNY